MHAGVLNDAIISHPSFPNLPKIFVPLRAFVVNSWQGTCPQPTYTYSKRRQLLHRIIRPKIDNLLAPVDPVTFGKLAHRQMMPLALARDEIQLTISDTGIGIDRQHQQLIFTKFYRVEDAK